jgi:hypothetical protein
LLNLIRAVSRFILFWLPLRQEKSLEKKPPYARLFIIPKTDAYIYSSSFFARIATRSLSIALHTIEAISRVIAKASPGKPHLLSGEGGIKWYLHMLVQCKIGTKKGGD